MRVGARRGDTPLPFIPSIHFFRGTATKGVFFSRSRSDFRSCWRVVKDRFHHPEQKLQSAVVERGGGASGVKTPENFSPLLESLSGAARKIITKEPFSTKHALGKCAITQGAETVLTGVARSHS